MIKYFITLYYNYKYRFVDEELCMCGEMSYEHGYQSNHNFVSAKKYTVDKCVGKIIG